MGSDKRYLDIEGIPLVEHVYRQMDAGFSRVFLSVADEAVPGLPSDCQIPDEYPGSGPMGGVISVLGESDFEINFVTACDIPWIPMSLVQEMLRLAQTHDIVVPVDRNGRYETLFAVYSKSILPQMRELLESGERRIRMLYDMVDTCYVNLPQWIDLKNLNTREDYLAYLAG
jgi:molybdopterin-guanine dinucleotide biosynthesis protein A